MYTAFYIQVYVMQFYFWISSLYLQNIELSCVPIFQLVCSVISLYVKCVSIAFYIPSKEVKGVYVYVLFIIMKDCYCLSMFSKVKKRNWKFILIYSDNNES